MKKIHIIYAKLIALVVLSGGTIEQRHAADLLRWCLIGSWLRGQIILADGALQILLEA